jgi:NAD(P)-dependent dehydrogenase (short-subunit alcohol dehydrogenase family)
MGKLTQIEIYERQRPLKTGMNALTTADEVIRGISLAGKTAIVTGGYSGLGTETARVLLNAGCRVIVPARDVERAREAVAGLDVTIEPMDLLDPASIDAFAERFVKSGQPLDILINNAGIMALPELKRDSRGYELQFATNHLGHFQLAQALLPALERAGQARVISVSSWGHHFSPVLFDDPNFDSTPYDAWVAYGQSKTANILFALALDERYKSKGIRAIAVHPGGILGTNLARHVDMQAFAAMGILDENGQPKLDPERNLKSIPQGAATQVWCATSPQLEGLGGIYCENCDLAVLETDTGPADLADFARSKHDGLLPYALDIESAERLWDLSEKLVRNH